RAAGEVDEQLLRLRRLGGGAKQGTQADSEKGEPKPNNGHGDASGCESDASVSWIITDPARPRIAQNRRFMPLRRATVSAMSASSSASSLAVYVTENRRYAPASSPRTHQMLCSRIRY